MLAWILKIKPVNSVSVGSTSSPSSTVSTAEGAGAKSTKASRKVCTPKPVKADPKNTGVNSPAAIASASKSLPASRINSAFSKASV